MQFRALCRNELLTTSNHHVTLVKFIGNNAGEYTETVIDTQSTEVQHDPNLSLKACAEERLEMLIKAGAVKPDTTIKDHKISEFLKRCFVLLSDGHVMEIGWGVKGDPQEPMVEKLLEAIRAVAVKSDLH